MACPKDFRLASPRVCTGHFVKGSLSDMYAEVENVGRQTDRQTNTTEIPPVCFSGET